MISDSNKFIFIHVPKTGGNSIQEALKIYSNDEISTKNELQDGVERFGVISSYSKNLKKHSTLSDYKRFLPREIYENYKKIVVIRNPWDRMISLYFSPHSQRSHFNEKEFKSVIRKAHPLAYYINEISLVEKMSSKLDRFNGNKYNLKQHVDHILKFENLSNDILQIEQKLNMKLNELKIRNKSTHENYQAYYNLQTKDLVYHKFKNEISTFGYEF